MPSLTRRQLLAAGFALPLAAGAMPVPKAPAPLRLLILGGTRFIGPPQVAYALARGHRVTVFNRGTRELDWPSAVEQLRGDRDTDDYAALAGRRWDVCIDNPTSLPRWVRGAGRALAGRVDHYVFVSTISVYRDPAALAPDESAPVAVYRGPDAFAETRESMMADVAAKYGALKALCEAEARNHFGDAVTVVRPGVIAGPRDPYDRFTYWAERMARPEPALAPGDGRDPVQLIDVRDLAEWTVRLAEARTRGTFNAVGPAQPMTFDAFLHGVMAAASARPPLVWAPAPFLAARGVEPWQDLPLWLPRDGEDRGVTTVRNAKALAAGLSLRPLADTTRDTRAWLAGEPVARRETLAAGLTAARERELLAALAAPPAAG